MPERRTLTPLRPLPCERGLPVAGGGVEHDDPGAAPLQQLEQPRALDHVALGQLIGFHLGAVRVERNRP